MDTCNETGVFGLTSRYYAAYCTEDEASVVGKRTGLVIVAAGERRNCQVSCTLPLARGGCLAFFGGGRLLPTPDLYEGTGTSDASRLVGSWPRRGTCTSALPYVECSGYFGYLGHMQFVARQAVWQYMYLYMYRGGFRARFGAWEKLAGLEALAGLRCWLDAFPGWRFAPCCPFRVFLFPSLPSVLPFLLPSVSLRGAPYSVPST
jgi:hypothetical protein